MSIPEIQVDLDYANRSSSVTKEITSPSGEKIKFKVKFTGGIFKEWKKAKLMVDPHTPVTPPQSSLTSTNHANMKDLYELYKSSIPWSERLYYWLRAKRHKSKILNKMFTIYHKRQIASHLVDMFSNTDEYNTILELGGRVLCNINKDGTTSLIPINQIDNSIFDVPGYELHKSPDGVTIMGDLGLKATQKEPYNFFKDAIKESKTPKVELGYDLTPDMISKINVQMKKTIFGDLAVHESTDKVKKESTDNDLSPEIKAAIEKQRKVSVDTALSKMAIVDSILKEAKAINDEARSKYPLGTAASVDVVHEEVFGDISIIGEKTETVTKTDELPSNWEYPSIDTSIISNKSNMVVESDTISPNVQIREYNARTESDKLYKLVDGAYIEVTDDSSKHS